MEIERIYVANVKSKSYLASETKGRGSVEVADIATEDFYWCGTFGDKTGALKEGEAKEMPQLLYNPDVTLNSDKSTLEGAPIGQPFYIYQNQTG